MSKNKIPDGTYYLGLSNATKHLVKQNSSIQRCRELITLDDKNLKHIEIKEMLEEHKEITYGQLRYMTETKINENNKKMFDAEQQDAMLLAIITYQKGDFTISGVDDIIATTIAFILTSGEAQLGNLDSNSKYILVPIIKSQ